MIINRSKILEYLFYVLPISFFVGKTFKVVAGLIVVFFLIDVMKKRNWEVFRDTIFIILALWCLYLFSSALWAINYERAMRGSLELFLWCLLYLAIRFTLVTKKQIIQFIQAQGYVAIFVVLNALIQFVFGLNLFGIPLLESFRVTDPFTNTRILGYIFPHWIGLFGAILASKGQAKNNYIFYSIVIIGLLLTLPLTGSRGPLVILAIFLPLIAWVSPFRKLAFIALGGVMISVVLVVISSPQLKDRLTTLTHPFENQKHLRIPIWLVAIEEFKDNPILGVGFHNYRNREFEYYKDSFNSHEINSKTGSIAFHAHNPWLDILAEEGIVGLFFLLFLLFTIAKITYQMGTIVLIGSMGVWYSFSILNSGFVLSSGRWSFFMILAISFFAIAVNYKKIESNTN